MTQTKQSPFLYFPIRMGLFNFYLEVSQRLKIERNVSFLFYYWGKEGELLNAELSDQEFPFDDLWLEFRKKNEI